MIVAWVLILSSAIALLPTPAHAAWNHEAWMKKHHSNMVRQRAEPGRNQRSVQDRVERNNLKSEKHQRDLDRRLERDRKQRELEQLYNKLKKEGPENCKDIKYFDKMKSKYPKPNTDYGTKTFNNKVYSPNVYKELQTYECTDDRYDDPFYKLVTVVRHHYGGEVYLDGGTTSYALYYDKDWNEIDWEPDMDKYKKRRSRRHGERKEGRCKKAEGSEKKKVKK